jgi:sorting nexin-17
MHIHIPTVSDAVDSKGTRFKVFDTYVNGIYHGSFRYSQILDLHNNLVKSEFNMTQIVEFPPKIFRISDAELEQRKKFLERYIHCCKIM